MAKLRLILLSTFILAAVGAATAASAWAEDTCAEESGPVAVCVEKTAGTLTPLASGTKENFTGKLAAGESLLEVPGLVHIECTEGPVTGSLTQGTLLVSAATGTATIKFANCTALEPNAACKVAVGVTETSLTAPGPTDELLTFKPTKAGVFTTVTFSGGECLIAGKDEVTGEVTCKLDEALVDQVTKTLLCTHENKGLQFAKKPATLEADEEITLESKLPWSLDLV